MTDLTTPELHVAVEDGVARLRITRAERRNSMDSALVAALRRALRALDEDDEVRALLLDGIAPGFCAGSDLRFISSLSLLEMARFEQDCGDVARLMGAIGKPVVAAVEGFAIGGGLTLATSCDVVVCGRGSRWSLPEVPHGWLTPWGIGSLVSRVGVVRARNLCYCLEPLNGEQAAASGLADEVVDDGQALPRALERARQLAMLPAPAVQATKRFFATRVLADAEAMDVEANRWFVDNCREAGALHTLERYRAKGVA